MCAALRPSSPLCRTANLALRWALSLLCVVLPPGGAAHNPYLQRIAETTKAVMGPKPYRKRRPVWALHVLALSVLALLAGVGVAFTALPLHAAVSKGDMTCGSRHDLVADLDRNFDERLMFRGVTALGNLVEVFTSAEGSWTILVDHPGGFSCVLSAGFPWEISDFAWRALQTPAVFVP